MQVGQKNCRESYSLQLFWTTHRWISDQSQGFFWDLWSISRISMTFPGAGSKVSILRTFFQFLRTVGTLWKEVAALHEKNQIFARQICHFLLNNLSTFLRIATMFGPDVCLLLKYVLHQTDTYYSNQPKKYDVWMFSMITWYYIVQRWMDLSSCDHHLG